MNAIDILKDFMCEMHIWETSFCKAQDEYDEADHDTKELCGVYREKLKVILEKYSMETTPNRDRLVDLGCTVPATYTPHKDKIISIDEKHHICKIHTTQTDGLKSNFIFTLCKTPEGWKIKEKHRLNSKSFWVISAL